jgi:GT2 family glycosyltransferase
MISNFIDELTQQATYEFSETQYKIDIIIVCHNQLNYMKKCVETIYENTKHFNLFIWDNASDSPTADYLKGLKNVYLERSEENLGFIIPNNILFKKGTSPYVIFLNSDTEVMKGWDTALLGWLVNKPEYGQVGYLGGLLDSTGQGGKAWCGEDIDYVCGWCFALSRKTGENFGLFDDKNLEFAYGEDADLSIRITEAGYKIRALHLNLVHHHGNATISEVKLKRDCKTTFERNHQYIRHHWSNYLANKRALLRTHVSEAAFCCYNSQEGNQ